MERGAAPAGVVSSAALPGGPGTPLYGHYDPCARSSLIRPALISAQGRKRGPGSVRCSARRTRTPLMVRREAAARWQQRVAYQECPASYGASFPSLFPRYGVPAPAKQ